MSTRTGRPCPVDGCDRRRDPTHVMCLPCWRSVPQQLRDDVWRTVRANGPYTDDAAEAREAAIAAAEHSIAQVLDR